MGSTARTLVMSEEGDSKSSKSSKSGTGEAKEAGVAETKERTFYCGLFMSVLLNKLERFLDSPVH
jgi:hypothetical protein